MTDTRALGHHRDVRQFLTDLEWLLSTDSKIRVRQQNGQMVVQVTIDLDADNLVVCNQVVTTEAPLTSLSHALTSARRTASDHQRRTTFRLVEGAPA